MRTPDALQILIDDGVIDEVLRPLKSGKEAAVYVVRSGEDVRCAKVYKDMAQRSFQKRVTYQEGRKSRGSREARAMGKATNFGRKQAEAAWKNAEVDALYQLREAGVRVPHNVLVGPEGPVVIDFPQVVSAAGNNNARTMLLRDVNNLTATLGAFAPELLDTWYGEEMWALFEAGDLRPDTPLTGEWTPDESEVDLDSVRQAINDAREEAIIRQQGREAAEAED